MDLLNISECNYEFFNTKIHQPSISELSEIFRQEEDLIFILKLMTSSLKTMLNIDNEFSEFQIFLGLLFADSSQMGLTPEKKIMFLKLMQLCFNNYNIELLKESFILKNKENEKDFIIIDSYNFEEFKSILQKMFDIPEIFGEQEDNKYNPKNERAARIANMIKAGNKKTAEINKMQNKKGIIENYISILSIGLKIPPSILCKNLTLYNLFNLYKRFTMKTSWDLDIDCRLAGASPKDSPENWMSLT